MADQSTVVPFNFKENVVRTIAKDGEAWFVATDIADVLGYRNAPDMTRNLDNDEKDTHLVRTLGGEQQTTVINESGLYHVVLSSKKPEAKTFRKWVTSEVLPSIRKTDNLTRATASRHTVRKSPDKDGVGFDSPDCKGGHRRQSGFFVSVVSLLWAGLAGTLLGCQFPLRWSVNLQALAHPFDRGWQVPKTCKGGYYA